MKSILQNRKKAVFCLLALFSSILLCLLFLPILLSYYSPMKDQIYDYSLVSGDSEEVIESADTKGWSTFLNEKGAVTNLVYDRYGGYEGLHYNGQTFYYSRILDQELEDPTLRIGVANRSVSVFLDQELLYTDWPEEDNRIGYLELPMQDWDRADPVLVSLPTDYFGKTLTIAQSTSPGGSDNISGSYKVFPCSVKLYCGYAYESSLISQSTRNAFPVMLMFLLGTVLLLLMVYQGFHGRPDWGLLFFSGFFYLNMAGIIVKAPYFYKYFPSQLDFPLDLTRLIGLAGITCLLFFLSFKMTGPERWILTLCTLAQGGLTFRQFLTNLKDPSSLFLWGDFGSVVALALALILVFFQCRHRIRFFMSFRTAALLIGGGYLLFLITSFVLHMDYWGSFLTRLSVISPSNVNMPLRALRIYFPFCTLWAVTADFISRQAEHTAWQTALKLQEQMARDSYNNIRRQAEETAILHHDFQKHLTVVDGLLSQNQKDEAKSYIEEVLQQSGHIRTVVNTGNYIMDIVLNSRLSQALDAGIELDITRAEVPSSLPLSDTELSSVLLNALDNALKACMDTASPWIRLDLHAKGSLFYFSLENSAPEWEPGNKNYRSNKGVSQHGYGLRIMERIAEKYRGTLQVKHLPGRFRVSVILPIDHDDIQSEA